MRKIPLIIFCCLLLASHLVLADRCEEIDMAFSSVESTDDKKPVCRCYTEGMVSVRKTRSHDDYGDDDLWIGCTGYNMPAVFRSLDALNETFISRLVIWNSLMNVIPSDIFSKVRPKTLSLENCMVSLLRSNAFGNIGRRMKTLLLRNNAFQRVETSIANELPGLEKLDLSGNKISLIGNNSFVGLTLLKELSLDNNHLSEIRDGDFHGLQSLKTLNLANNKISKINRNAFDGLDNLEVLILKGNNLADVDWTAFHGLKKLKVLDMGTNHLADVDLRRLQNLQRLYLNNNSIQSLKKVVLRDLTSLESLSLDRNFITKISNDDLNPLGQSTLLSSFSLVSNKIAEIDSRAFEHLHGLTILSIQNNELTTLEDKIPFLHPLKRLKSLYLSHNKISTIGSDSLEGLTRLKELSLDHNLINKIENGAFKGTSLNKLFLNGNQLYYLPKGLFDGWKKSEIYAVDLSENPWSCICSGGDGWLSEWLYSIGEANTPQGKLGCLAEKCDQSNDTQHPPWMTAIAITFTICILACIIIIGFLLVQEGKRPKLTKLVNNIYRVPSDREQLIVSDPISFPNPIVGETEQEHNIPTRTSIKLAGSSSNGAKKKVHFTDS